MFTPVVALASSPPPLSQAGTGTSLDRHGAADKLANTAKEFEAILLGQWLQAAESSFATAPGAEEDSDSGDDQMKSFGVQQLAKSMSDTGGIGIAKLVTQALSRTPAAPTVSQDPLITTVSR